MAQAEKMMKTLERSAPKELPNKPFAQWTREEKEDYKTRMKRAAGAPKLASLQIKQLDQMIQQMKKKRWDCQVRMDQHNAELGHIQGEIDRIMVRYVPLQQASVAKQEKLALLKASLKENDDRVAQMLKNTRAAYRKGTKGMTATSQRYNSATLELARGYSTSSHRFQ